jgi:exopolysaccharide production protein ExoZ
MFLSLQYVRGGAALLVVYFHAVLQIEKLGTSQSGLVLLGESGVDVFFVLSGFLMWVTTHGKEISPIVFFKKRLLRVAPIYWLLTLICSLIAFFAPDLLKSTVFDIEHIFYSLLFFPHINPANGGGLTFPVIVPGWTLNFEMLFYAIFSFCLLVKLELIRLVYVCIFIFVFFVMSFFYSGTNVALGFYFDSIIIEFLFGVFLGYMLTNKFFVLFKSKSLILFVFLLSFFSLLYFDSNSSLPRFLVLGVPAFFVIYSCVVYENSFKISNNLFFKFIGDSSYSIYLTHIFVIAGVRVFLLFMGVDLKGVNSILFVFSCVFLSIVVGGGFYVFVESKIDVLIKKLNF